MHVLLDKPRETLTIAAILLDGVGRQLDGVLAGIFLGKHQLLHLTLCVQDSHLQDCGSRGRKDVISVHPQTGFMLHREACSETTPPEFGVGPGVATVLTYVLLGS